MPEFHLDQNVPGRLVAPLRPLGYTAYTARDLGLALAEDAEHLLAAWQADRVLVTKDRNFYALHFAWRLWPSAWRVPSPPEHAGILIIHDHWSAPRAAQEIHQLVRHHWPLRNQLFRFEGDPNTGQWRQY